MNRNEMFCVVCPIGCHLKISMIDSGYHVEGNQCDRGRDYAVQELLNPTRIVTSTIRIEGMDGTFLPVKTQKPFPKGRMLELMRVLRKITVQLPVKCGQVILKNALDTEIDVVSTKTVMGNSV